MTNESKLENVNVSIEDIDQGDVVIKSGKGSVFIQVDENNVPSVFLRFNNEATKLKVFTHKDISFTIGAMEGFNKTVRKYGGLPLTIKSTKPSDNYSLRTYL